MEGRLLHSCGRSSPQRYASFRFCRYRVDYSTDFVFPLQPYLDEVRFIGTVPTPWHSWAVVASPSTLAPSSPLLPVLEAFLLNLTKSIRTFDSPQARSSESVEFVKSAFGYPEEDVRAWFDQVSYPQGEVKEIEKAMVEKTFK